LGVDKVQGKKKSKPSAKFPERIYTYDEVRSARVLISKGYQHRLRIKGSRTFREKTQKALKLVKTAGYYDFLRTYIRMIREIEGLSQLREAEAALWVNIYAVEDAVDAACFFVQKAWQMKNYIEGKTYYGHLGETVAVDASLRFLETLMRRSKDPKIRERCQRKMKIWDESKFL
jgi:hypothetical protein